MNDLSKREPSLPQIDVNESKRAARVGSYVNAVVKFLVLFTVILGFNMAVNNILDLGSDIKILLMTAFFSFTVLYTLFKGIVGFLFGSVTCFLYVVCLSKGMGMSILKIMLGGYYGIINSILALIDRLGYVSVPSIETTLTTDVGIFLIVSTVSSVILSLSCQKRTSPLPFTTFASVSCISYVLFDPTAEIKSFSLLIASVCALFALGKSERSEEKGRKRSALNGALALLLAALLLLSPIVSVKTGLKDGMIVKDVIDDLLNTQNTPSGVEEKDQPSDEARDSMPSKREFTGEEILTVCVGEPAAVYLRNWVGASLENNYWEPCYLSGYVNVPSEVKSLYFNSYPVTDAFVSAVDKISDITKLGYSDGKVKIILSEPSKSLSVPSISQRSIQFTYGRYNLSYSYDGTVSSSKAVKNAYYCNALYRISGDSAAFSRYLYGYLNYLDVIRQEAKFDSQITYEFFKDLNKADHLKEYARSKAFSDFYKKVYLNSPDDPYLDKAIEEIFKLYDIEDYYVKYTPNDLALLSPDHTFTINGQNYAKTAKTAANVNAIAEIVADYLSKNASYSLDPRRTDAKTVTEELLFGGKEGYCVQFATVGTLIMRRLGFPTRYAEGYIASDFAKDGEGSFSYTATVTDERAHAWAEAWVDGFGFVTLEMTPGFSSYPPESSPPVTEPPETTPPESEEETEVVTETEPPQVTKPPITTAPDTTYVPDTLGTEPSAVTDPPATLPPDTSEPSTSAKDITDIKPISTVAVLCVLSAFGAAALIGALAAKAKRGKKRLDGLILRGMSGDPLNSQERSELGEALKNALYSALKSYKALPKDGELPEKYGKRLDIELRLDGASVTVSKCIEALCHQVYGGIMTDEEIGISASFLDALRKNAAKKLGSIKTVYYKIKGII